MKHTITDRGFKHLEPIKTSYGHTVRVYESSSAMRPCLWMKVDSTGSTCGDIVTELRVHMTLEQAEDLRDSLDYLIRNHYQLEE
jgi:hypothetical protein